MEESKKILRISGGHPDYQPLLHANHHDSDSDSTTNLDSELLRCHRIIRLRRKTVLGICALIALLVLSNLVIFYLERVPACASAGPASQLPTALL